MVGWLAFRRLLDCQPPHKTWDFVDTCFRAEQNPTSYHPSLHRSNTDRGHSRGRSPSQ